MLEAPRHTQRVMNIHHAASRHRQGFKMSVPFRSNGALPSPINKTKFPNGTIRFLFICKPYDGMDELYDLKAACK